MTVSMSFLSNSLKYIFIWKPFKSRFHHLTFVNIRGLLHYFLWVSCVWLGIRHKTSSFTSCGFRKERTHFRCYFCSNETFPWVFFVHSISVKSDHVTEISPRRLKTHSSIHSFPTPAKPQLPKLPNLKCFLCLCSLCTAVLRRLYSCKVP